MIFVMLVFAATLPIAAKSPLAGVWEGSMNDLPAVKLTIDDSGGKLDGTILFYFQQRGQDGKWHVVEGQDSGQPILVPQMEGKLLTFEVKHHIRHGSSEYGPNKKYSVEVVSADEARLREVGDTNAGKGLKLTRRRM